MAAPFYKVRLSLFMKQSQEKKDSVIAARFFKAAKPHYIKSLFCKDFIMAGGQGIEPWIMGPEPIVLPLYYPPVKEAKFNNFLKNVKLKYRFQQKEAF